MNISKFSLTSSALVFALVLGQGATAEETSKLKNVEAKDEAAIQAMARSKTFYYPKRLTQYGQLEYIFINATNGTEFCEEEGYSDATGGSILCGEDESSYSNFNWWNQQWEAKSTGSKNQCYPLYRSITCR